MAFTAEISGASIVFVGAFNAAIFSPQWFRRNELIGESDSSSAEQSSSLLVSRQVTSFELDWLSFQTVENQMVFSSKGPVQPSLRDIACGLLRLVPHTPVTAFGINFFTHFKAENLAEYHKVGDALAPKTIWESVIDPSSQCVGVSNLTMLIQSGTRGGPQTSKDEIRLTLQPSSRIKNGIFFQYNKHYEDYSIQEKSIACGEVVADLVERDWMSAMNESAEIFQKILKKSGE